MSYCRWSSDDFACDLYCYESSNGFETHVADNRVVGEVPKQLNWDAPDFMASHKAQMVFMRDAEREPIGLPLDGESFTDSTLEDFRARLTELRTIGYRFPDSVLVTVDEEIQDHMAESTENP